MLREKVEILTYIVDKHITNKDIGLSLAVALLTKKIYTNKVYENINYIIENNPSKLFKLSQIKELPEEIKTKIKKVSDNEAYLEETVQTILKDIYLTSYAQDKFKVVSDTIKIIIKEICQNENQNYSSIEYIDHGTFSYVFQIGNKILKIGKMRNTQTFPNNPFILTPLMRETIDIDRDLSIFLEVIEKAETNIEVTDEELYNLYKNLRQIGLVWTDIAKRNVGRLIRDNKIYWNDPIEPTDQSLELEKKRGTTILKKGSLVIIDADHIYDEKTPEAQKALSSSPYEQQYQKELEKTKRIANEKHYSLNELLDCRITNKTLHIHVVPKTVKEDMKQMGIRKYTEYAEERLEDALARIYDIIVKEEQDIQTIFAVSPLLSHNFIKKMFEKHGFNTSTEPNEMFEKMFPDKKIGQAIIKRDKFIQIQEQNQENKANKKKR